MFPLPPCWNPLPSDPPIATMVFVELPLLLIGLVAVIACAVIVGIDMARNRARREAERPAGAGSTRVIETTGTTSVSRAAAGGRG